MKAMRILVLACAALSARGAALYQFTGTYSDFGTGQITGPVTFSLSLPAPVTPTAQFSPGPQLTCSDCSYVKMYEQGTYSASYVTVGYGLPNLSEYYFYFEPQSYAQSGTYDNQLLVGTNDGVLTTTINNGNGNPEVPEPSTAALMIAGLGLCAVRLCRRKG